MLNHKKILQDSADFFNKEVDKVINKISTAKTEKARTKYLKQMMALKNRLALEIKIIDDYENL
jgi:hypothetical protein